MNINNINLKWTSVVKTNVMIIILFLVSHSNAQEIEFKEIYIGCLDRGRIKKEWVITSQEQYIKIIEHRSPHPKCISYQLPEIDFSKTTLLGFLVSTEGCSEPQFSQKIRKEGDSVLFRVEAKKGTCKMLVEKFFWIIISKELGTKIKFEFINQ